MAKRERPRDEAGVGVAYALGAFVFWGLAPIYFKAVRDVPATEVLAHRIVWALPVLGGILAARGRLADLSRRLTPRLVGVLSVSALLVACNWLTFIHGVQTDRILETSLGYYVNPLVNVVLGVVFLGERLRRAQLAAVLLAAVGTANLAFAIGGLPWIALTLALSFGAYGLVRKVAPVDPVTGLFVEASLLAPVAAGYAAWLTASGAARFVFGGREVTVLLLAAGLVTALPLIGFNAGAKRLRYSTIGILQYVAPSLSFLLAVFVYGEPFSAAQAVTFGCIWVALAVFTVDSWRRSRPTRSPGGSQGSRAGSPARPGAAPETTSTGTPR